MWIRGAENENVLKEGVSIVSDDISFHYPSYYSSIYLSCMHICGEREGGIFFSEDGCQLYNLPVILKTGCGAICVSSCRDQTTVSKKNEVYLCRN